MSLAPGTSSRNCALLCSLARRAPLNMLEEAIARIEVEATASARRAAQEVPSPAWPCVCCRCVRCAAKKKPVEPEGIRDAVCCLARPSAE